MVHAAVDAKVGDAGVRALVQEATRRVVARVGVPRYDEVHCLQVRFFGENPFSFLDDAWTFCFRPKISTKVGQR